MQILADPSIQRLAELNLRIIQAFAQKLGLAATRYYRASELALGGTRSERLILMAQRFGCDTYLSPCGAQDYLEEDGLFRECPAVRLVFQ